MGCTCQFMNAFESTNDHSKTLLLHPVLRNQHHWHICHRQSKLERFCKHSIINNKLDCCRKKQFKPVMLRSSWVLIRLIREKVSDELLFFVWFMPRSVGEFVHNLVLLISATKVKERFRWTNVTFGYWKLSHDFNTIKT